MKTSVVIENGKTIINLVPENSFEKRIIEDAKGLEFYDARVTVTCKNGYYPSSAKEGHLIGIELIQNANTGQAV
jgi:hypothetical protein